MQAACGMSRVLDRATDRATDSCSRRLTVMAKPFFVTGKRLVQLAQEAEAGGDIAAVLLGGVRPAAVTSCHRRGGCTE